MIQALRTHAQTAELASAQSIMHYSVHFHFCFVLLSQVEILDLYESVKKGYYLKEVGEWQGYFFRTAVLSR